MVEGRSRELQEDRVRGWDRLQAAYRYRGRTWLAVGVHTGKGETEARASGKDMGTGM